MSKAFSFRVDDQNVVHTRLTIFNHGANAGVLIISTDDVEEFKSRLAGGSGIQQNAETVNGTMIGAVIHSL